MNAVKFSNLTFLGFLSTAALAGFYSGINAIAVLFGGLFLVLMTMNLFVKLKNTDKIIQTNILSGEDDKKYVKKYKQADMRRLSSMFLFCGLSIAILSSIYAFEWKVNGPEVVDLNKKTIIDEDEIEVIPPTLKNEPEKIIPKIKEPEPEVELEKDPVIELVDDAVLLEEEQPKIQEKDAAPDVKVSEKVVEDVLVDLDNLLSSLEEEKEEETEGTVFVIVEEQPSFVGGDVEMMKFIYKNIKYPSIAKDNDIEGSCVISFIVETDGSISDAKIERDIGGGCGEEALRVVNSMPDWNPGKQRGKAVRVKYNLPVFYKMK